MDVLEAAIRKKLMDRIVPAGEEPEVQAQKSINITINGDIVINNTSKDVTRYSWCDDSYCEDQNQSIPLKKTGGLIYEGVNESDLGELVDI